MLYRYTYVHINFTDTDYLPIPLTDMLTITNIIQFIQNRGGGVEDHLKFVYSNDIVINCVGSQIYTALPLTPFMEKEAK